MRIATLFAAAACAIASPSVAEHHVHPALEAALADDLRGDDSARDQYRNPAETLTFFGVEPGMTVVDFMPSGGWYSRILIPYLGPEGTYVALNPKVPADSTGYFARLVGTQERFPAQAQEWVGTGGARVMGGNVGSIPENAQGTVDRLLIFREIHNLRRANWLHDTMLAARFVLKDDGLVGVVQHRAAPDAPASYVLGDKGYQREQDVIGLFEAYGFELVARSEINANPKDTADWENGVWSLPPSYRGAEEGSAERASRAEIGESDRMTLLFRKRP